MAHSSFLATRDYRQFLQVEGAEPVERGGRESVAGKAVDDAGEATDVAGGVEDAGLFLVGWAKAEEFHGGRGIERYKGVSRKV